MDWPLRETDFFGIICGRHLVGRAKLNIDLSYLSDHDVFELLKGQDADAWVFAWQKAVLAEARSFRNAEMVHKWGISPEELMGRLYEEMIGRRKIELYRDDGGSVIGWLRTYVRGYILQSNPDRRREVSLSLAGAEDDDQPSFEEKVSREVSDAKGRDSSPLEDPVLRRQEEWSMVQRCFGELWRKSPLKAYVHLLKLRLNLSSRQIKDMLGISSEANVDQLFSRAVKDMRKLKVQYE